MKKLVMMFAVAGVLVCCKGKEETEAAKEVTSVNSAEKTDDEIKEAWELYKSMQAMHKIKPCDIEVTKLSEQRHRIDPFNEWQVLAQRHSRNTNGVVFVPEADKGYSLSQILQKFKDNKVLCYNGWLEITYNETNKDVDFKRSDDYSSLKSLYSEPLFVGIKNYLTSLNATNIRIHFFNVKLEVDRGLSDASLAEKVAVRVTYDTSTEKDKKLYYDMSDDPL